MSIKKKIVIKNPQNSSDWKFMFEYVLSVLEIAKLTLNAKRKNFEKNTLTYNVQLWLIDKQ